MHITKPQRQPQLPKKSSGPKNHKFTQELSKAHPEFKGVQKIRREEIGEMLKKADQKPPLKNGKYLDIKRYKFRPDVWELNGEILYKSPYENIDEPTNEYVKKLYDNQKTEIKEKKIQILELQKKAKQKRLEREQKEQSLRPKNTRKYSNDLQEHEINELNKQMKKLNKDIDSQQEDNEEDEEEEQEEEEEQQDEQEEEEEEEKEEQNNDNDSDGCQEIEDFGELDDMKEDASFEEEGDISQSFVSQNTQQKGKFQSDFANQLDNAFSQLIQSDSTNSSQIKKK